ncbi:uncharacterized protein LOC123520320 isoform X2 [Portunus trituberculatus]|uniref:uncharacterized protein LOC123520320 isoform X2 n=1 Tax=Portunus trituberculatus TaxID=210409 RepID=UPI001E1CFE56|nr:uncharacterized protein LOC123520320 isoform X2 [Portunus trituberculatus]
MAVMVLKGWLLLAVVVMVVVQVDVAKAAAIPWKFPSYGTKGQGPPINVGVPHENLDPAVRCILCPTCPPCHMMGPDGKCRPIFGCKISKYGAGASWNLGNIDIRLPNKEIDSLIPLFPNKKVNSTVLIPNKKVNSTFLLPNKKVNSTSLLPNKKVNSTSLLPNKKVNSTSLLPNKKVNSTSLHLNKKVNSTSLLPNKKVNSVPLLLKDEDY